MAVADKIMALLDTMTIASLDELVPARRRQFAELCRHWARVADRPRKGSAAELGICPSCGKATKPWQPTCGQATCIAQEPRHSGVLADLKEGRRDP